MSCYICLGSDKKKPFAENPGCLCKGSISIHASCFRKWLSTASNPLCCSVCKSNYAGRFLQKFMTPADILFSGEVEEEEEFFYEETFVHGVPVLLDEEGYIYFDSARHESIFNQSDKMLLKGIRQQTLTVSKNHYRRHSIQKNRPARMHVSRKR
jgi:hypothetical protein